MDKRRDKAIVKRERTRRALMVEQREQLDAAEGTIKDYKRHFRYLLNCLDSKHNELDLSRITAKSIWTDLEPKGKSRKSTAPHNNAH